MKVLFLALVLVPPAAAREGKVAASLVASVDAAAPGESFDAGLRLRHAPHWHTYWINPGDSGLATVLEWTGLPRGWSAGPLEWPAPERIVAGPLTSFGYSGDVILPVRVQVPPGAKPGTTERLTAEAEWLECAEICVPGRAKLSLDMPVAAAPRASERAEWLLSAARARLPRPGGGVSARLEGAAVLLAAEGRHPGAEFFPRAGGLEAARGSVEVSPHETVLALPLAAGEPEPERLEGVLVRPGLPPLDVSVPVSRGGALLRALLLAFAGGLLLNLMPCVFPVLSLKVLGLVGRAGGDPRLARRHAAAYAAGVVLSFQLLAAGLLAARAAGASLGWGFQLQSPPVVAALALLFIGLGLNLSGLFEVGTRWTGLGARLSSSEGYGGSFSSGVFAVIVAAPCTAPFMGAALGWALLRPAPELLAAFAALGLGTAAPYALLASWPALLRRLPRPGAWMETLKKALSVPMFATAAWLLWVLWRLLSAAPVLDERVWKHWSSEAVAAASAEGKIAFVDFTAAWCLSCQANERLVLARPEVAARLAAPDVAAFKADWTSRDPVIAAELRRHGRAGVPLYVVYPRGGGAVVLPEILTPGLVLEALGEKP